MHKQYPPIVVGRHTAAVHLVAIFRLRLKTSRQDEGEFSERKKKLPWGI
jgi:hypothetical protein